MIHYISSLPDTAPSWPRAVAVMGSTGSIGVSTLDVLAANPGRFTVPALAAGRNARLLAQQAAVWRPDHLAVLDDTTRKELDVYLSPLKAEGYAPTIHLGPEGYAALASLPETHTVVSAQVGAAGLAATHAAVLAGKTVALANKESLVLAGDLLRAEAAKSGAVILPVDSEHNAIFQCLAHCLAGKQDKSISKILLTASGGPFRGKDAAFVEKATPSMALKHPNWSMGAKITIDSATMMNKGLEVIEACHLYGVAPKDIEVLVHPQSIVHSLVQFSDAGLLAQAGPPDMRTAIGYCLGWPERIHTGAPILDLTTVAPLSFEKPDLAVFRCLTLAQEAMIAGKGLPVALNAANEIAVDAFLAERISFGGIARLVETVMDHFAAKSMTAPASLEEIMAYDHHARAVAATALPA